MGKNALLLSLLPLLINTIKARAEKVAIITSERGREMLPDMALLLLP